jgi:dTDP-4-amino-4,6-dideoxygalactose transaminase
LDAYFSCNDFDKIKTIIKDKNILLIEDNCESMGATFNGQQACMYPYGIFDQNEIYPYITRDH